MKRLLKSIPLLFCLLALPLTPAMTCSPTVQKVTFDSLYATGHAVNAAYAAYNDLLVAGKVSTNSFPAVAKNYQDFQNVYGAALVAAQFNANATPSPDVSAKAAILISSVNAAKKGQ